MLQAASLINGVTIDSVVGSSKGKMLSSKTLHTNFNESTVVLMVDDVRHSAVGQKAVRVG